MIVKLISKTKDALNTIYLAAAVCYQSKNFDELLKADDKYKENLIEKVVKKGHLSVIEHANFTFYVEGVSRVLTHQLVRHRIASFSQQSQRYVDAENFGYVVPESLKDNEEFKKKIDEIFETYFKLKKEVKKEDARFILPNATTSRLIFTMNARQLLHFLSLRMCKRAQWEIRDLAFKMKKILMEQLPIVFKFAHPKCVRYGKCTEGLNCGYYRKVPEEEVLYI